jgi:hypothetical protein
MGKTVPVPEEKKQAIYRLKSQYPSWSGRTIAEELGMAPRTVERILEKKNSEVFSGRQELQSLTETSEVKGDTWNISLPETSIHTLEELLEYCKVDLTIWETEKFVCNKWELGYKNDKNEGEVLPLFQVKAFLKKKKNIEAAINEIAELKELAKENFEEAPYKVHILSPENLMLELTMPDVHFGKLAWGVETGHANYDVKIAESIYWTAFETILSRAEHRWFNNILFVVGNDILNSDDIEGRTTSGTYVSSDARYHKTFSAVRSTQVRAIEKLRKIAPVKVITVQGNHDQLSCWHLGDSLECYFHNYADVEIDNLPRQRKYHEHGLVGLMWTHGHKAKRTDYPALMAAEQPQMWGRTKYRECHTGHLHMTKTDEQHGFRTRILPSLTAPDDWLATNGFVGNLRNAEGYVWSGKEGLVEQVYYTVPE